jgi:hypothetical protein
LNRTIIVTVSQKEYPEDTLLGQSYYDCHNDSYQVLDLEFIHNDDYLPLAKLYNQIFDEVDIDKKYEYIVFCHDDVTLNQANLPLTLERAIGEDSSYDICGVAGNTQCKICDKNLWHLMGTKDSMSGFVAHYNTDSTDECFMTNFGVVPQRVILLDGLFLALNLKKILEVGLRFDEDNPADFHFYDLNLALDANKLGLKMTTWPISLIHKSHGLNDINNPSWVMGNKYFKEKWSK